MEANIFKEKKNAKDYSEEELKQLGIFLRKNKKKSNKESFVPKKN